MQFKEMGGRSRPTESHKMAEQPAEKKKGFADWLTAMKPVNEEKDHWVTRPSNFSFTYASSFT